MHESLKFSFRLLWVEILFLKNGWFFKFLDSTKCSYGRPGWWGSRIARLGWRVNVFDFIAIKLDSTNYLAWETQLVNLIEFDVLKVMLKSRASQNCDCYIRQQIVKNTEYLAWKKFNKLLEGGSERILLEGLILLRMLIRVLWKIVLLHLLKSGSLHALQVSYSWYRISIQFNAQISIML